MSFERKSRLLELMVPAKPFFTRIANLVSAHELHLALSEASSAELNGLLSLLHGCTSGIIPIQSNLLEKLIKSKKMPFLRRTFENENKFKTIFEAESRQDKLTTLYPIKSLLPLFAKTVL